MAATSVLPDASPRKGTAWRFQGVLLFLVAAVAAFLLYRPDTNAPFEIIDFSETLPFLTDGRTFGERFTGLVGYYLQHGRAAFALSAGLAAKWTLFEWWTPGWQWVRYVVGLGVVVLAWHLMRALGANRVGATVGASLFLVSETVAPGWLRAALNEPFGTLLLLGASLIACRYQGSGSPGMLATGIAALLVLIILVKETLVAASFFPVFLALCRRPDGMLTMPERSARNNMLVASSALAIAVVAVPVLWALTRTASGGYAKQFGASGAIVSNAVFGVLPALIPFTPISQPPAWATTAADLAWLVLLVAGLRTWHSDPTLKAHARMLIGIALALPLARMLIYMPWPLQFPYYSIPFLTGVAIVAAMGVTRLAETGGAWRTSALVAASVVILYAGTVAGAQASRHFAVRRLTDALVGELHTLHLNGTVDSIIIAVPRAKEQAWWGLGPTLSRFAAATGRPLPVVREVTCAEGVELATSLPPRVALAALRYQCRLPGDPAGGPVQLARRFDLSTFRSAADTLRAQIVRPIPGA